MDLNERRERMISYLHMKVEEEDWHGVADAAMDLRDIDAEQKGRDECLRNQIVVTDAVSSTLGVASPFQEEVEGMGFSSLAKHWERMKSPLGRNS